MVSRSISDLAGPEVAAQIGRNPLAVLPFGSIEQHGPHLPNGTDTIAAELIAADVADRLGGLLVPFAPYGITPIHAGHPGTISLSRATFEALLTDVCDGLVGMGVNRLVFVNWHEGNNSSLDAVATEIQADHQDVYVVTSHACYVAQRLYADRGGELTHGGGIEALAVMAHEPGLIHLDRAGDANRPSDAVALDQMRRNRETHGYITDVTEIDQQGWYGDPAWATSELADGFVDTVAAEVASQVKEILALRPGSSP